jgi:hypothetical protein
MSIPFSAAQATISLSSKETERSLFAPQAHFVGAAYHDVM